MGTYTQSFSVSQVKRGQIQTSPNEQILKKFMVKTDFRESCKMKKRHSMVAHKPCKEAKISVKVKAGTVTEASIVIIIV